MLQQALIQLKAVHLAEALHCPTFRKAFSDQLEEDNFIADKTDVHQHILLAQQIERNARESLIEYNDEYSTWLDALDVLNKKGKKIHDK